MGDLTQTFALVGGVVAFLAMLPAAVKWLQARTGAGQSGPHMGTRLVSAVAVGPHQRVVTVEVGPAGSRTVLVLGVTQQTVSCLHSFSAPFEVQRQGSDVTRSTAPLPAQT